MNTSGDEGGASSSILPLSSFLLHSLGCGCGTQPLDLRKQTTMPNGDPDFDEKEFPVLESFFAPIADLLTTFAARYNLMLEKYYHQLPSWRLNFRHPKGGVSSLEVMRDSPGSIKVYRYWWIDDYDNFSRSIRRDETQAYELTNTDLNRILEEQFRGMLSWDRGAWTQVATGYESSWKRQGRKFIESEVARYPEPKV